MLKQNFIENIGYYLLYFYRSRGWNGSPAVPAGEMKPTTMRPVPSSDPMHRRRMPDYPPPHELKRRYSPGREADMRARKRMRCSEYRLAFVWLLLCLLEGLCGWLPKNFHVQIILNMPL